MSLAAADVAEALSAIREEGALCQFETIVATPIDANKPWLGSNNVPSTQDVYIAFVDAATAVALIAAWKGDVEVASSTRYGLMGNHDFVPQVGQRVLRQGKEALVVKDVMEAAPADIPVFYVLEFNA